MDDRRPSSVGLCGGDLELRKRRVLWTISRGRVVSRAIERLPGFSLERVAATTIPGRGSVLLVVSAQDREDQTWAFEAGQALMEDGRTTWVVEVREQDLRPDDPPEIVRRAVVSSAILWPIWATCYGPHPMAARDLAQIMVKHCHKRQRWCDPLIVELLDECDETFLTMGLMKGEFKAWFFKERGELHAR